ncbi:uncharacterized protein LOC116248163 [Nymphaea colorata]|uniref:Legume lectin domain-containing protein n=1 Tax=Nymphaea colorata TaxID=210225 RepID=A0A5K1ADA6_9MAGN|nr:uncharacterized protein LOC116248163 [Nymphaea colorata]
MAAGNLLLQVILLVSLMSSLMGVQARPGAHFHPCRTFLISYSYSFSSPKDSLKTLDTFNPSELLLPTIRFDDGSSEFSLIRSDFSRLGLTRPADFFPLVTTTEREFVVPSKPAISVAADPVDMRSSLHARARDILTVVVSLLFGVACGALTASTMYLVWSLFNNGCDFHSQDDEFSGHEEYIKIPSIPEPVKPKEGYEGN